MMSVRSRANAAPSKQSRRFERSPAVGIARDRAAGAPLSVPSDEQLLICLDEQRASQTTAGRALVPLDRGRCPDCSTALVEHVAEQLPLFRHGGYGEAQRTVRRICRGCGWVLVAERKAVKP